MWYQLRGIPGVGESGTPTFSLAGGHDFDEAWVADVRDGVGANETRDENAGWYVTKVRGRKSGLVDDQLVF